MAHAITDRPLLSVAVSAWKVCPRHTVIGLPNFTLSARHDVGPSGRVAEHGAQLPVGLSIVVYGSLYGAPACVAPSRPGTTSVAKPGPLQ